MVEIVVAIVLIAHLFIGIGVGAYVGEHHGLIAGTIASVIWPAALCFAIGVRIGAFLVSPQEPAEPGET